MDEPPAVSLPTDTTTAIPRVTDADLAAAWDRLQAARGAVGVAYARYRLDPTPENRTRLRDAAQEDSDAGAEYTRLYQQHYQEAGHG